MSDNAKPKRTMHPNSLNNLMQYKPGESGLDRPRSEKKTRTKRVNPAKAFQDRGINPFDMWAAILSNDLEQMQEVGIKFKPIYKKGKKGEVTKEIIGWSESGPIPIKVLLGIIREAAPYIANRKGVIKAPKPKDPDLKDPNLLPSPNEDDNRTVIEVPTPIHVNKD